MSSGASQVLVIEQTFGQRSNRILPVLAALQDRLDAVSSGDNSEENQNSSILDEVLESLGFDE